VKFLSAFKPMNDPSPFFFLRLRHVLPGLPSFLLVPSDVDFGLTSLLLNLFVLADEVSRSVPSLVKT